jgi:hypothetical protein
MTYEESAALMKDMTFIGRVKVAALKYATYIYNEPSDTVGHSSRVRWAQQTSANPDMVAANLSPMVVMDSQVQTDGAAITDSALQSAVEAVVNKTV